MENSMRMQGVASKVKTLVNTRFASKIILF